MTRYFFHIRDGGVLIEDPDGTECEDVAAARIEALSSARDLLAERLRGHEVLDGQTIEIWSEDGTLVDVVLMRDAINFG
jgi:hypothetical protein